MVDCVNIGIIFWDLFKKVFCFVWGYNLYFICKLMNGYLWKFLLLELIVLYDV